MSSRLLAVGCTASLTTCSSLGAWTPAGSRTPTSSRTRPAGRPCSSTRARRSSRCSQRSASGGSPRPTSCGRTPTPITSSTRASSALPVVRRLARDGRPVGRGRPDAGALGRHGLLRRSTTRELVFSGDTLFKDAVGGGDFEQIRSAVMDVYMPMPHDRRRAARAHRRDDDRARMGGEPVRPRLARRRARGHRAGARARARRDADRLVARTTTARARRGCASTTARTRSSAAHAVERS